MTKQFCSKIHQNLMNTKAEFIKHTNNHILDKPGIIVNLILLAQY